MNTFAPIAWSALKISAEDLQELFKINKLEYTEESIYKVCAFLETLFPRNNFRVRYDYIQSDFVFNTMDMVIDFFLGLLKAINKTFRTKLDAKEVNWKPITKKLRAYLYV